MNAASNMTAMRVSTALTIGGFPPQPPSTCAAEVRFRPGLDEHCLVSHVAPTGDGLCDSDKNSTAPGFRYFPDDSLNLTTLLNPSSSVSKAQS